MISGGENRHFDGLPNNMSKWNGSGKKSTNGMVRRQRLQKLVDD
jgi:hypothetical protein